MVTPRTEAQRHPARTEAQRHPALTEAQRHPARTEAQRHPALTEAQRHRAGGVLLAMAAGDALGAPYEFGPPLPDEPVGMIGGGAFGWEPGEWTDDTQMALVIAQAALGGDLREAATLDAVAEGWIRWARSAKDVGAQTSAVLRDAARVQQRAHSDNALPGISLAEQLRRAAAELHERSGRTAGNGSLMRTAPVALALLGDEAALAATARRVSDLTHADPEAGDACVIWTMAIRHAVLTGEISLEPGLAWLPADRAATWRERLAAAELAHPAAYHRNGWVVEALQAAWCAIVTTRTEAASDGVASEPPAAAAATHLERALTAAARSGGDTDTVAAIAGALLGAVYGASAVPSRWRRVLHGWPGLTARDLVSVALRLAEAGRPDTPRLAEGAGAAQLDAAWPGAGTIDYSRFSGTDVLVAHPHDPGVLLGGVDAVRTPPAGVDAVVSLCRLGADEVPAPGVAAQDHVEVWLVDTDDPAANPHLDFVLADTAEAVAALRAEGRTVLLHCVRAESRTPTVAARYSMVRWGMDADTALAEVQRVLPAADPNPAFRAALGQVRP